MAAGLPVQSWSRALVGGGASGWTDAPASDRRGRAAAWIGLAALAVMTGVAATRDVGDSPAPSRDGTPWHRAAALGRDVMIGAYGGASYTHPGTLTIRNPGRTDLSVQGVRWDGQPFKSPIYYGLRTVAWPADARFGTMLDFTHAKAIARLADTAGFSGTLNGQTVPPKAPVGDVFRHLEFSHGHNIVTINGLVGLGAMISRLRPYAGIGAGVTLPHTEIGYTKENGRTYEYQYAGVVGQALAGIEVRLGAASLFFEYKFTYAPYSVPLSGVVNGWLLFTDVWRQFRAWSRGEAPPGGTLATTLVTHHGIAGLLVRVNRLPIP